MPGPGSQACPKPSFTKDKRQAKRDKERAWQTARRAVLVRDGRQCRVCGSTQDVDVHHIRFRSVGGGIDSSNLATICRLHHADLHGYRLAIEGDANKRLRITWL